MGIKVHVTKNGKRFYQLYYVDPVTEERHWRSTKTTERRAAERAAAKWEAELIEGTGQRTDRATWDCFRQRFETEHLAHLAPKTIRSYRTALNAFEAEIKPARLASVSAEILSRFAAQLRQRKSPVAESSINTYLIHLTSALRWAVGIGLLAKCPHRPRIRNSGGMRRLPATGEQLERMLKAVPEVCPKDAPAWMRYLRALDLSGLRLDESIRLSWDATEAFIVEQSPSGEWNYRIYSEAQKSRRDQLLPVAPEFAALLDATPADARHGPVFVLRGKTGQRLRGQNTISRIIGEIAEKADCKVTAHDFRRAFGTRWALRVLPPILQKLMRHRSVSTTMKYYVHLEAADLSAALKGWQVNPLVNPRPAEPDSTPSADAPRN